MAAFSAAILKELRRLGLWNRRARPLLLFSRGRPFAVTAAPTGSLVFEGLASLLFDGLRGLGQRGQRHGCKGCR